MGAGLCASPHPGDEDARRQPAPAGFLALCLCPIATGLTDRVALVPGQCTGPDLELFPGLNEIQTDVVVVDTKVVQFELNHSCINSRMLCYDDNSACTSAPSLVEFISDDSSTGSLSFTGNASHFSTFKTFQMEVDQPHYNYHGPKIVPPKMSH